MQRGIQCLDRRGGAMFCKKYHRPPDQSSLKLQGKPPMFEIQNHFTNILNQMFARQTFRSGESEIKKFLVDHAMGHQIAIRTLSNLLCIKRNEARLIVKNNLALEDTSKKNLVNNCNILLSIGCSPEDITKNVKLLAQENLGEKIEFLRNCTDIDLSRVDLKLLQQRLNCLRDFVKVYRSMNKESSVTKAVEKFAEELKVEKSEMFKIIVMHFHEMVHEPQAIMAKLKMFNDYGISPERLTRPNSSINLPCAKLEDRMKVLKNNFLEVRLSKLNMNDSVFNRYVHKKLKRNPQKSDHEQLVDYLMERTNYSKLYINWAVKRIPKNRLNFENSWKNINLLMDHGYDYVDFFYQPKLLTDSPETLRDRFGYLKRVSSCSQL